MEDRFEMRFTGSGGQGIILISIIFAEAAVLSGLETIQSQSYGPEARGGACKAETMISRSKIWFSKVTAPAFLLALNQKSLEKYAPQVDDSCLILADESLDIPDAVRGKNIITLPVIAAAKEATGKTITANMVAVGAINAILGLFSDEFIRKAVCRHIPEGTEEMNYRALETGFHLGEQYKRSVF